MTLLKFSKAKKAVTYVDYVFGEETSEAPEIVAKILAA